MIRLLTVLRNHSKSLMCFQKIFNGIKTIKSIFLIPSGWRLTTEEFENLDHSLKNFCSLQYLDLDLDEVMDNDMHFVKTSLKRLRSLRELIFSFTGPLRMTEKGVQNLLKGLKRLPMFESLVLHANNLPLTEEGFLKINESLRLLDLKRLRVNFGL